MKYVKILTSESDYNEYRYGNNFSRPNVTLCENNNSLKYKDATYDLTINYINQMTGQKIQEPFIGHYLPNENYNVVSPTIEGYIASPATVSGTMPEKDRTLNVIYSPAGGGEIIG